jgi:hypothetical protein
LALSSLLPSLGRTLKDGGCPSIDKIASIVAMAIGGADLRSRRREVSEQLEKVRRESESTRTDFAVDVARRILVDANVRFPNLADRQDSEHVKLVVAEEIVIGLAIQKISSSALTRDLVENENMTIDLIFARRQHAKDLLASAPQIEQLARKVLRCPDGQTIKAPRVKTPKPSQEELTFMEISS